MTSAKIAEPPSGLVEIFDYAKAHDLKVAVTNPTKGGSGSGFVESALLALARNARRISTTSRRLKAVRAGQPEGRRGDERTRLRFWRMPPRACTILLAPDFDVAVTMGCGDQCPFIKAVRREDWQIPDPKEMPPPRFREVRDLIEAKVKELMAATLRRSGGSCHAG